MSYLPSTWDHYGKAAPFSRVLTVATKGVIGLLSLGRLIDVDLPNMFLFDRFSMFFWNLAAYQYQTVFKSSTKRNVLSLNRLQLCLSREWFPPSSACGNKTSCFFQCLDDHEYCMMVILSAFLLPVAKIVKLIHPRITKMGFALESAMLSNSYPNLPTEASPYIGVSFFNTRRRPPLSDPYLPKNRSNELIWEPTPEVGKRNKKPPRFLQSSNDESCR